MNQNKISKLIARDALSQGKIDNLLQDSNLCFTLTAAQLDGHHDLHDLARDAGHCSLRSCLTDLQLWDRTVAEVAAALVDADDRSVAHGTQPAVRIEHSTGSHTEAE